MNENLKDIIGFLLLAILGVAAYELIKIKFEDYVVFLLTGCLYLLYRILEESK